MVLMQDLFISHFSRPSLPSYDIWDNVSSLVYLIFANWQVVFPFMSIHGCNREGGCKMAIIYTIKWLSSIDWKWTFTSVTFTKVMEIPRLIVIAVNAPIPDWHAILYGNVSLISQNQIMEPLFQWLELMR
jgi:hypothetical protein